MSTLDKAFDMLSHWQWEESKSARDAAREALCFDLEDEIKMLDLLRADLVLGQDGKPDQDAVDAYEEHVAELDATIDDMLQDTIHATCDGWLIYTREIVAYIAASSNDEAWEDLGYDTRPDDATCACLALIADVTELFDNEGNGVTC